MSITCIWRYLILKAFSSLDESSSSKITLKRPSYNRSPIIRHSGSIMDIMPVSDGRPILSYKERMLNIQSNPYQIGYQKLLIWYLNLSYSYFLFQYSWVQNVDTCYSSNYPGQQLWWHRLSPGTTVDSILHSLIGWSGWTGWTLLTWAQAIKCHLLSYNYFNKILLQFKILHKISTYNYIKILHIIIHEIYWRIEKRIYFKFSSLILLRKALIWISKAAKFC